MVMAMANIIGQPSPPVVDLPSRVMGVLPPGPIILLNREILSLALNPNVSFPATVWAKIENSFRPLFLRSVWSSSVRLSTNPDTIQGTLSSELDISQFQPTVKVSPSNMSKNPLSSLLPPSRWQVTFTPPMSAPSLEWTVILSARAWSWGSKDNVTLPRVAIFLFGLG